MEFQAGDSTNAKGLGWEHMVRSALWRLNPSLQSLAPMFSPLRGVSVLMFLVFMYCSFMYLCTVCFFFFLNQIGLTELWLWSQKLRGSNSYTAIDLLVVWPGTRYSTFLAVSFSFVKLN